MPHPRLSVVVPTRNRPQSLFRLLQSISEQTLEPTNFEVVVVDDGSEPPLDEQLVTSVSRFPITVIRRKGCPGAHESRCAGLAAAVGERVVFLDDDVVLTPSVLIDHAAVQSDFAIGPIKYHPRETFSPFHRYQAIKYSTTADSVIRGSQRISALNLYICNSSGPRMLFGEVLRSVSSRINGTPICGDGHDEALIGYELAIRRCFAQVLSAALVLHIDTKSLEQARAERHQRGMTIGRLLMERRTAKTIGPFVGIVSILTGNAGLFRVWRVRLIWLAPVCGRWIGDILTALADRGPSAWVPAWTCHLPLFIAFWDGVRKVAPSYLLLRATLCEKSSD